MYVCVCIVHTKPSYQLLARNRAEHFLREVRGAAINCLIYCRLLLALFCNSQLLRQRGSVATKNTAVSRAVLRQCLRVAVTQASCCAAVLTSGVM